MSTLRDEVEALKAKAAKLRQEAEESAKVSVNWEDVSRISILDDKYVAK